MSIQDNPLYDQLFALLQKAEMLEATNIPESRKNINIGNLDISIGMANMINNMGIYTIWDLVHLKLASRPEVTASSKSKRKSVTA